MKCPKCGCLESVRCYKTTNANQESITKRLRRCFKCGTKFGTEERPCEARTPEPTESLKADIEKGRLIKAIREAEKKKG